MKLLAATFLALLGTQGDFDEAYGVNWPKTIDSAEGAIVLYEPQIETFKGDTLTARMAVSVGGHDIAAPAFGGVWIKARLLTDRDHRTATPVEVDVTEARFPQAAEPDLPRLRETIATELVKWRLTFSLDQLLTDLAQIAQEKHAEQEFRNEPPKIYYRNRDTVLVSIDGAPLWHRLPESAYWRLSNSSYFILREGEAGPYLLHVPPYWWDAEALKGPWNPLDAPPPAARAAWESEPKAELPSDEAGIVPPERPEILVSTEPAELVVVQGPPDFQPIAGTNLLYARNTESDLFLEVKNQMYYVLLAGRWYRRPANEDTWTYVPSGELPESFARIPVDSPKSHVLSSVGGTPQANDALLDAQIPQTAAVTPNSEGDFQTTYDGAPVYEAVQGSVVQYIVNTPYSVFRVGRRHYCCHDGIWYASASASGPWIVTATVPDEIYLIPPSCPLYFCTYCRVFGATPTAVYVGYYPGYRGCYVSGPTVVFGTGWHYRPWTSPAVCIPRPVTWGAGVRYSPHTGNWRFPLGTSGPTAWMGLRGVGPYRNASAATGVGGWWSGSAAAPATIDVHRNLHFSVHAREGVAHNLYSRRPERLAPVQRLLPPSTPSTPPERRLPNNLYSDRSGNVYRRPSGGEWERHDREGWKPAPMPAPPRPMEPSRRELELQNQSRDRAMQRVESYRREATPQSRPPSKAPTPPPPPKVPPHR